MKIVLVTGAAGFIGSNMIKFLLEKTNYKIFGVDNFLNGTENKKFIEKINNKRFKFIKSDFVDFNFEEQKIDIVYHFAAIPSVPFSVDNPILTSDNNISKTLQLLDNCSKNKVKRFIFSSSASIYGDTINLPTNELESDNCKSPYALQKLTIEKFCKLWSEIYDLETVCLRYFNIYGPNQYSTNAYSSVICSWIKGFVNNTSIRLDGDGLQSRSFTYVEDVCEANFMFGELKQRLNGNIFNIADEKSYTLLEILNKLIKISGKEIKVESYPVRNGDIKKSHADISKVKSLNYNTKIDLEKGLIQTYNWYKKL
jgi:nucleoside-diphosphate-sugar epimerase